MIFFKEGNVTRFCTEFGKKGDSGRAPLDHSSFLFLFLIMSHIFSLPFKTFFHRMRMSVALAISPRKNWLLVGKVNSTDWQNDI